MLALRLAARELRTGTRGLRIVLACLALGVASIGAVGGLRVAIERGLSDRGREILGGDLAVNGGAQALPDTLRTFLRERGARLSDVVQMRSMLVAGNGERSLIELKAVDAAYPLVGTLDLTPPGDLQAVLAGRGLVGEPVILDRLGVHPGDSLRVGQAQFVLKGSVAAEPDGAATPGLLGPGAVIALADLPATGLVQPGSLLRYELRAAFPPGTDVAVVEAAVRERFGDQGWRIRDSHDAAPGVVRFIDQTSRFMTLVGLTALLVGGIGVATGVRAWLEARARGIAVLRCLGASSRLVFATFLIQVAALSVVGVAVGVAAGAALPALGIWLFGSLLPVPPRVGIYWGPLGLAALYGLLTAGAFSLWPLGRAARIPGAALFRDAVLPGEARPSAGVVVANVVLVLVLVGLTVATAPQRGFAMWFCGAAAATLLLFRAGGWALMRGVVLLPSPRWAWARLGLGNLHRPGTATPLMMVALGLGLSTLCSVAMIEANIRRAVLDQIPADAPTFFFIDIQPDQLARFDDMVHAAPGTKDVDQVPSLRARMVAVNGVPVEQVQATPDTQWALRGDRGLTFSAAEPEDTRLVAGQWWPADYAGPPLVSFDAKLAQGWGVKLGDMLRINVLGRDIDLRVASLRDINWRTLSLNFTLVASPGLLAQAPHSEIATVYMNADPRQQGALLRQVTDALPNVTGIRVADVLDAVASLVRKVAAALAATGSLALAAGALVLAGTVAAGQRRRIAEAVVLKSLGATRRQIRAAWLVEFGVIGLAAGLLAALVGTAASWGVVRFLMDAEWTFLPGVLAATVSGCVVLMLGFGYAGTAMALRAPAASYLRNE
ncbi:MAG: ABC transporter permease [Janthinobacterium lividum]